LKRKPGQPDLPRQASQFRRFGNPDDVFAQAQPKSTLITQSEVRAISLAQLDIQPTSVVWDIGAGSGSVSIEAAQIAERGMVYAIEMDAADYHLIIANMELFGVKNLKPIHGVAPGVFADLPTPDAIFVGGTSREVSKLLQAAYHRLRAGGRMSVNVATLESLHTVYDALKSLGGRVEVLLVQIARGITQIESLRFESANPTFLLTLTKS
jgi:precorrin-6Y C5,15-methyltransferase (decarboxylating)